MKIALTHCSREETLDRAAQEVRAFALGHILAHLVHRIVQHIFEFPRSFRRFRRVLRHVLHHSPQIQARPPIHIPHVGQQHVLLIAATQLVVPRKARMPLPFAIALLKLHPSLAATLEQFMRKTVPTNRARLFATSTRMHAKLRPLLLVHRVPFNPLHKRSHQTPHPLHIHFLLLFTFRIEHVIQQRPQIQPLRRRSRHSTQGLPLRRFRAPHRPKFLADHHVNVVRADLIVPLVPPLAAISVRRVPFLDHPTEKLIKLLLQIALQLHPRGRLPPCSQTGIAHASLRACGPSSAPRRDQTVFGGAGTRSSRNLHRRTPMHCRCLAVISPQARTVVANYFVNDRQAPLFDFTKHFMHMPAQKIIG